MNGFVWSSHVLHSSALNARRVYRIILPEGELSEHRRLPLLILLHGVTGSETDWIDQGGVVESMNRLLARGAIGPMAVLTPSDGLAEIGTGYLNWKDEEEHRYEDYLLTDTLEEVETRWPVGGAKEKRAIAGLSMGGYAAFRIGLSHPHWFAGASSLSGFFDAGEMGNLVGEQAFQRMFKNDEGWLRQRSPLYMEADVCGGLPLFLFDCGTSDGYIEQNRSLRLRWLESGVPHRYVEKEGAHTWHYWSGGIPDHLVFHYHAMNVKA